MTVLERLQSSGIRRLGSPAAGFRYRKTDGGRCSRDDRERIAALAVPPAWSDVRVSASPAARVQAIGRDRAGRWQYLYSESHARAREASKQKRLLAFLVALPSIRARVARDVRSEGLGRERVLAAMVRLLLRGFLRPGSAVYTRENGTYGLSTLRARHVRVEGRALVLSYVGKAGKPQLRRIEDAAVLRVMKALLAQRGRSLFRYQDPEGRWARIGPGHINAYLREIAGGRFTAKDFRTWAGTLFGACALARQAYPEPVTERALRHGISHAMRETAQLLGNTPAVCRASYVSPAVIHAYERGRVLVDPMSVEGVLRASSRSLAILERRLAQLIREGSRSSASHSGLRRAA